MSENKTDFSAVLADFLDLPEVKSSSGGNGGQGADQAVSEADIARWKSWVQAAIQAPLVPAHAANQAPSPTASVIPSIKAIFQNCPLPQLEKRMLLEKTMKVSRVWLMTHDDETPSEAAWQDFVQLANQRLDGMPMAYIMGKREFMGLPFEVSPDVLIPRPDTELLVETALQQLQTKLVPMTALDLGTGSGAIAIAMQHYCASSGLTTHAVDVSEAALNVAKRNAVRNGVAIQWHLGSWFEPLPAEITFDVIVSNPPYIAASDPHLTQGDLRFEPSGALTDGGDGLQHFRQLIAQAPSYLKQAGSLWLEHGYDQGTAVRELLHQAGYQHVKTIRDLGGNERVTGGYKPDLRAE